MSNRRRGDEGRGGIRVTAGHQVEFLYENSLILLAPHLSEKTQKSEESYQVCYDMAGLGRSQAESETLGFCGVHSLLHAACSCLLGPFDADTRRG